MKQRDFIIIFGSSCALVLLWIVFTLVHTSKTSTVNDITITSIKPIPDSFDMATLEKVRGRLQVQPVYSITTDVNSTTQVNTQPNLTPTPVRPGVNTATSSAGVRI